MFLQIPLAAPWVAISGAVSSTPGPPMTVTPYSLRLLGEFDSSSLIMIKRP